jgi:hypothetical protein
MEGGLGNGRGMENGGYVTKMHRKPAIFRHLQSQNNWKPCVLVSVCMGMAMMYNPAMTVYNPR